MKRIIIASLFMIVCSSLCLAESVGCKLNIFSESEGVKIFLDNKFVGEKEAILNDVEAGEHYIKAELKDQIIFSDVINIDPEKISTLLIKTPGKNEIKEDGIANSLTKPSEEDRQKSIALKDKLVYKQVGVGFEIGWPFYGLSVDYWPVKQHGLQLNFYSSNNGGSYYSVNTNHVSLRYKYRIADAAFIALGIGKYSDNRPDYYDYYSSSSSNTTNSGYYENLYGLTFGYMANDSLSYEFGYAGKSASYGTSSNTVCFSVRYHYYFGS